MKKSGVNGRGGVWRCVYGPSLGRRVELGASNGAGDGNALALGKVDAGMGTEGEAVVSVVAEEDEVKVVPLVVVSIEGCEA